MQWEFTMHAIPLSGKHTNKLQLGHNRPSSLTYIIHSPSQSPFFDNQLGFPPTFSQLLSSLYLQSASRSLPSHECGNVGEPGGRRENSLGPLNRPAYLRARSHSLSLSPFPWVRASRYSFKKWRAKMLRLCILMCVRMYGARALVFCMRARSRPVFPEGKRELFGYVLPYYTLGSGFKGNIYVCVCVCIRM